MKFHHLMYASIAGYVGALLIGVFIFNLPAWCEHPDGAGNWMVQPLCKK